MAPARSQAEKAYPPNFAETTERRRINLFRRISVSSASLGGKFFACLAESRFVYSFLQTIAACRGAINGLMAEVIEGHIRFHVINPDLRPTSEQAHATQELIDVINTYLK